MSKVQKLIQKKVYYVCRRCKQERAVIVALHRALSRQVYNSETRKYDAKGYRPYYSKILLCEHCGTVDLRTKSANRYLQQAVKIYLVVVYRKYFRMVLAFYARQKVRI